MEDTCKIKFKLELHTHDEDGVGCDYNVYKCCSCHYNFVGDIIRFTPVGYYASDTPNYCPGCGKKVEDLIVD